jgi:DNA-binding transcriptional regulator YbjK
MDERAAVILDAAIDVLAHGGARQLTHRAVDARASLPLGSTSNRFRTRDALLAGVLQRLVERESALWLSLSTGAPISDAGALTDVLARAVDELSGPARELTTARYAVVTQPELPASLVAELGAAQEVIRSWLAPMLSDLGSRAASADATAVLALVEGLLLTRLSAPAEAVEAVDARRPIRGLLAGLLAPEPQDRVAAGRLRRGPSTENGR